MNADSWQWLVDHAQEESLETGEKRYIIGEPRHYQGWHGWAYSIATPEEYVKHRAQSVHPIKVAFCAWCPEPNHPDLRWHPGGQRVHRLYS